MNFLGSAILFVALAGPLVAGQQYFRCGAAAPYGHCGSNNSHAVPPTWDITYIYHHTRSSPRFSPADHRGAATRRGGIRPFSSTASSSHSQLWFPYHHVSRIFSQCI
ncbi:hypothetical protein MJO29_003802 [Puccinia striiformis f. sp. tritici]|nr:hypothetical protein Pst134EB_008052 [Puccinia striiformis f. sp. tritici]KAI7963375.1 hypothetical protein MJO29_003802 [Puccinia striiformis f. sp. tritici]